MKVGRSRMAPAGPRLVQSVDVTIEPNDARTLLASAEKTEQQSRPTAESLEVLRRRGTLALRTPERFGGAWANATTVARHLAELGRYCPSTAWIAGTCATAKNF